MFELTIGYVAGAIAAAIFIARIWSPNVITFILSGILRESNSAATWTAASQALQRTHWSWILQTDGQRIQGVRIDVVFLTWFITVMSFLTTLAGIVTPLGLHETFTAAKTTYAPFVYVEDKSSFEYGTPPRSDLPYNRICKGSFYEVPCPFTDTVVTVRQDELWTNTTYPYGYDIKIPSVLRNAYSSGTSNSTTVSNFFDIEWRRYRTQRKEDYNNGSAYLVGSARLMESMVLRDNVQPVEGLLVDSIMGGIGFRNHTVPEGLEHGASWSENHLFIEPETACVDTNLTIDYQIVEGGELGALFANMSLTDRGGFVNLKPEFLRINISDSQKHPQLYERAYRAAWMTNAMTAVFYNVTNPADPDAGETPFKYMNSKIGARYSMFNEQAKGDYDLLSITDRWDAHLNTSSKSGSEGGLATELPPALNPFGIKSANFSDIGLLCSGAGSGDLANITNIIVRCGLMRGIPTRLDGGISISFDANSTWSQPLYACATAVKATIKTVHFSHNGTQSLASLKVVAVENSFSGEGKKPLWGVEKPARAFRIEQIPLLWGLLDDAYEGHPNISTVRQESLYLPGYIGPFTSTKLERTDDQNLPASTFYKQALGSTYTVESDDDDAARADYSGATNMALWAKWQDLSKNAATASKIPNLIFTDHAAASVVGVKGVLGHRNRALENVTPVPVSRVTRKISYRIAFAIPALMVLLGLIVMTLAALAIMIFRHHNLEVMRQHLHKLSPGRIFTTFLHPEQGGMSVSSKQWSQSTGKTVVTIAGDYPTTASMAVPPQSIIINQQEKPGKQLNVVASSVSEGPSERDQFLTYPLSPPIPRPYSDANRQQSSTSLNAEKNHHG